jgi:hypothetical protein
MKKRKHHEIYLSDFRKVEASKLKTILRIPVKRNNRKGRVLHPTGLYMLRRQNVGNRRRVGVNTPKSY